MAAEIIDLARRFAVVEAPLRVGIDRIGVAPLGGLPHEVPILALFNLDPNSWGQGGRTKRNTVLDCDHLCAHAASGRDYFLTWDRGILGKRAALLSQVGIHVMSPEEFLLGGYGPS